MGKILMKTKIYYFNLLSLVFCRQNQFRDTENSLIFNNRPKLIKEINLSNN